MGFVLVQSILDGELAPLLEKAPYVGAVVGVVWIFTTLLKKVIGDFRETIHASQLLNNQTAKECHELQQRSIDACEKMAVVVTELRGAVHLEKDTVKGAIDNLTTAVKEGQNRK